MPQKFLVVKFSRGSEPQLQFVVWSTVALVHLVRAAGSLDPDWTGLEVS